MENKAQKIITILKASYIKDKDEAALAESFVNSYLPYLKERGFEIELVAWNDETVDWSSKKFILVGPIWDYNRH